jgi:hypothetical protein
MTTELNIQTDARTIAGDDTIEVELWGPPGNGKRYIGSA